jgi:D-glycero-alpha-D-manno-heptose-7-phosphate kinase
VTAERVFRASAPVRLDFAGGWTDVAPFASAEGGVVVNAAIELRAHAEVRPGGERYRLQADDLGREVELEGNGWTPADAGDLKLLAAAVRRAGLGPCAVRTRSEVPPGSGLSSSGALGVALAAALDAARHLRRTPEEWAEAAFQLEAVDAALPGGRQDQYAAALGSLQRLAFGGSRVVAEPLRLDPAFAAALEQRIVVCYTGTSRLSSSTIARVMQAYTAGDAAVVDALRLMADLADRMARALLAGNFTLVGRLLTANWRQQQRLDAGMQTVEMERLERAMLAAGALGGKAAGAGAGGCMFFLVSDPASAREAATKAGARVLEWKWASGGVRVEQSA